jgi:hypothetical protein
MNRHVNRREFIQGLSAAAAGFYLAPAGLWAKTAPTAPVAVAKCATYGPEVGTTLATMFDQLGGIEKLVRDKTVAMKINVTGSPPEFFHKMPVGETYWVHPQVVGSVINLLGKAGARRIRLVESPTGSKLETLQEFLALAKWNPTDLSRAASGVEFDNTNWPGPSGKYKRLRYEPRL